MGGDISHSRVVDGLADFIELAVVLEGIGAHLVPGGVVGRDGELGVVAPLVGVADLVGDGVELFAGAGLGGSDIQSIWSMSRPMADSMSWTIWSILALLSPAKYWST